jgi:hypothetical protein
MSILSQFKQSQNTDFPNVRPSLDLRFALAKKLDPRITFTRGSTGTYFGSDGLMRTAGVNEPRFDHDPITGQSLGLLIEESRTNLVRNNTSQGAVAGTPGTLPTNSYAFTYPSGTTSQVVSVGTENGIPYFDIRFYGVSSQNGELSWVPQTGTNTPITGGQVVSASAYLKVVSGTFANITNLNVRILDYNGSSYLAESSTIVSASSLQSSTLTRYSHTRTTGGSANGVVFSITLNKTSAGPVDITLRIGMPQIEVGSFPTSVIPNSSISSTVTRSADNASMTGTNFSSWYNSSEGSVYCEANSNNLTSGGTIFIASNASYTERFAQLSLTGNVGYGYGATWNTNSRIIAPPNNAYSIVGDTYANGAYKKIAVSASLINLNGVSTNKVISKYLNLGNLYPTGIIQARIGSYNNNVSYLNGTIKRLTYYPIQLTNQQLINLSS